MPEVFVHKNRSGRLVELPARRLLYRRLGLFSSGGGVVFFQARGGVGRHLRLCFEGIG